MTRPRSGSKSLHESVLEKTRDLAEQVRQTAERVHQQALEGHRLVEISRRQSERGRELSKSGREEAYAVTATVGWSIDKAVEVKRRLLGKDEE